MTTENKDPFELDIKRLFGERIELDKKFAESVYAALCNMQYKHVHTNHLYGWLSERMDRAKRGKTET